MGQTVKYIKPFASLPRALGSTCSFISSVLGQKLDYHPPFPSGITKCLLSSKMRENQRHLHLTGSCTPLMQGSCCEEFMVSGKGKGHWDVQSGEENKWDTVLLGDDVHAIHLPRWYTDTKETEEESVELKVQQTSLQIAIHIESFSFSLTKIMPWVIFFWISFETSPLCQSIFLQW